MINNLPANIAKAELSKAPSGELPEMTVDLKVKNKGQRNNNASGY